MADYNINVSDNVSVSDTNTPQRFDIEYRFRDETEELIFVNKT